MGIYRTGRSRRRATCGPQSRSELLPFTHHDAAQTRDISADHARSNPSSRLSESFGLLRVSLVQSQRGHECRRPAGRNAGALFMSQDGLHGLRPDRSRGAAGLVAAHEQAAVVIRPLRRTSPLRLRVQTGRHLLVPSSSASDPQRTGSKSRSAAVSWRIVVCYRRGGSTGGVMPAAQDSETIQVWRRTWSGSCVADGSLPH
jgi:hypothetical protein